MREKWTTSEIREWTKRQNSIISAIGFITVTAEFSGAVMMMLQPEKVMLHLERLSIAALVGSSTLLVFAAIAMYRLHRNFPISKFDNSENFE